MNPQQALLLALANLTQQVSGMSNALAILNAKRGVPGGGDTVYDLHDLLAQIERNTADTAAGRSEKKKDGEGGGKDKDGGGVKDSLSSVFDTATAKIAVILAPMVGLAAVVGSVTSGFQPLLASMKVMAAVFGSFLLPVFAVLAAAVLTAAVIFGEKLRPVLEDWYKYVFEKVVPKLGEFADSLLSAVNALREFWGWLTKRSEEAGSGIAGFLYGPNINRQNGQVMPGVPKDQIGKPKDGTEAQFRMNPFDPGNSFWELNGRRLTPDEAMGMGLGQNMRLGPNGFTDTARPPGMGGLGGGLGGGLLSGIAGAIPNQAAGGGGGPGFFGRVGKEALEQAKPRTALDDFRDTFKEKFGGSLKDVIQSMQMSLGNPGTMGSAGDRNRRAQEALLKQDPIQEKLDRFAQEALALLGQVANNTYQTPTPVHPGK